MRDCAISCAEKVGWKSARTYRMHGSIRKVKKCATTTSRWWGTESRWRNDRSVLRRNRSFVRSYSVTVRIPESMPVRLEPSRIESNRLDSTRLDLTSRQFAGRRGSSSGRTSGTPTSSRSPSRCGWRRPLYRLPFRLAHFQNGAGRGRSKSDAPERRPRSRLGLHHGVSWCARDLLTGPSEKIRRSEMEDREDDGQDIRRTYARARAPEKTFDAQQLPRGPVTKISAASFCFTKKKKKNAKFDDRSEVMPHFSPVLTSRISAIKALGSILPSLRGRDVYTLPVTHTSRCTL